MPLRFVVAWRESEVSSDCVLGRRSPLNADPLGSRMSPRHNALLFIVLCVLLHAGTAIACRCLPEDSTEAQYKRADLVFLGRVVTERGAGLHPTQDRYWEFEVTSLWKGPAQREIRIYAHPVEGGVSSCDRIFVVGDSYLVFAFTEPGFPNRFQSDRCSGTVSAANATQALAVIGDPPVR